MIRTGLPICVVDVETTGLDPRTSYVHDLAAVILLPCGKRFAAQSWSIRVPLRALVRYNAFKGAQKVHGIPTSVLLTQGALPADVVQDFLAFVLANAPEGVRLAGHNVHFDAAHLHVLFKRAGYARQWPFGHRYRDLSTLGAEVLGVDDLKGICDVLGIYLDKHHTAMGDAYATADAYNRLRRRLR